jgi:hypothetical protein
MASYCIRLDVINFVALRPPTICFHRSLLDGVQVLDRSNSQVESQGAEDRCEGGALLCGFRIADPCVFGKPFGAMVIASSL